MTREEKARTCGHYIQARVTGLTERQAYDAALNAVDWYEKNLPTKND